MIAATGHKKNSKAAADAAAPQQVQSMSLPTLNYVVTMHAVC
jgi:hypothetical protein